METNTNIKYTPSERELYKIELAAERINTLLKALDAANGSEYITDKTLEDLNAIIQTIIEWDTSDNSLGVKEQLLNIYNSMLSVEAFEEYKTEIEDDIADLSAKVDSMGAPTGDIDAALDSIIEIQNSHIGGTSDETV